MVEASLTTPSPRPAPSRWRLPRPGLPLLLFAALLALTYPTLFPTMADLGPYDESVYIASGRALLMQGLPSLASNPLVAALYSLFYLPLAASPRWFILSASLGRIVLFVVLCIGFYRVARRLEAVAPPAVTVGVLLVAPILSPLLRYPSDGLFAALAALAFAELLAYVQHGKMREALAGSAWLGLATLARSDGLTAWLAFLVVALAVRWKRDGLGRSLRALPALTLPFVLLVGGYIVVRGVMTGSFNPGIANRSYIAFEQGQAGLFQSQVGDPTREAQFEAARLFGSGEENGYSILRAIRRNPTAYLERLGHTLGALPSTILDAYGQRIGPLLLLLALRGVLDLLQRRAYALLAALLLWPLHLVNYFLTFFRPGYLLLPFFCVLALGAIGVTALTGRLDDRRERWVWTMVLLGAAAYGILDAKLAVFAGVLWFLVGLIVLWLAPRERLVEAPQVGRALPFVSLLLVGLLIRPTFPSPMIPSWEAGPLDGAVSFLQDHLAPGERVISAAPEVPYAAGMKVLNIGPEERQLPDSDQFARWLADSHVQAIYWTGADRAREPQISEFLDELLGTALELGYRADPGDMQILLVRTSP